MKRLPLLFLLLAVLSVAIFAANPAPVGRVRTYDVLHYTIRLEFNRNAKSVKGDSTIDLTPLNKPISVVELDSSGISYSFVGLEGSKDQLKYAVSGNKLRIVLPREFRPGEKISIRTIYSATPDKGIYFVDAKMEDGKVVRGSQIWTQGESEETHHWLPSYDFPDDKATTEQYLTVDKGETAISNGRLVDQKSLGDGRVVYHYRMDIPHSLYLTSFVIGTYSKVSDEYRDIPLGYYVYPGDESIVPLAYGNTKNMMAAFEKLTGIDYPYTKYDQTTVADFQFGGMENITATTMADTEINLARFKFGQSVVEDLVSHELAHSWFGNLVTCRNWAELWLNEGFATFMEAAYREQAHGRANYDAKIRRDATEYLVYASTPGSNDHPLFNTTGNPEDDDTLFTTVTYQKGGAVLHTLREELGDKLFWKGVNLYLEQNRLKAVGTSDLKAAMEEASGKDLGWFFDQWVYKSGYPKLRVRWRWESTRKKLVVTVNQTQSAAGNRQAAYRLPMTIQFTGKGFRKDDRIVLEKRAQNFVVELPAPPRTVKIDPDNKIPLKQVRYPVT